MKFKMITLSDPYYEDELMLRWEVLEKPLGLPPPGKERSNEEKESVHLIALEKNRLIGCILCHPESGQEGKIIQFVLSKEYKGWSFGRKLVQRLEEVMVQKGISHVYVMAREEDHNLFVSLGYEPEGERIKQEGAYLQKMSKDLFVASA